MNFIPDSGANAIKAEIYRRNKTLSEIAVELGISRIELSQVIHGHRIRPDVRKRLARILHIPEARLFRAHPQPQRRKAA